MSVGYNKESKKKTNPNWNHLQFNNLCCVGGVMDLCRRFKPTSHREFYDKYIESGEKFREIANKDSIEAKNALNNPRILRSEEGRKRLSWNIQQKAKQYGRDKEFIQKLSAEFAEACNIPLEEAKQQVYDRLFVETFDGYKNEKLVVSEFNKRFGKWFTTEEADSSKDATCAVDLVVKETKTGREIGAIQVKPKSYLLRNDEILKETKDINKRKNTKYGRPVYYVFYDRYSDPGNTIIEADEGLVKMMSKIRI